ncbi:hypothetical protein SAZ11_08595 [Streptomyces sp. FXJ1.4098]|nr:hypothetical protein [Streptomyces sp. FXJ1.4098]
MGRVSVADPVPWLTPWLAASPADAALDVRAAADHIYTIVERTVEWVARDAEQYLHEALPSYVVTVTRPEMTETLPAGYEAGQALVTALGALNLAAAELDLTIAPGEARAELEEHGSYVVGPVSIAITHDVNWAPAPKLKCRPVVPASDRLLDFPATKT